MINFYVLCLYKKNVCKGSINTYINFESISSVTYFFHVRILDTFFFSFVSQFISMCF